MAQPFEVGPGGGQVGPDGGEVGPSILGPNATGDVTQAAASFAGTATETITGTATVEQAAATVSGTAVIISGAVTVTQAAARVSGHAFGITAPPTPTGAPSFPFALFKGQVVSHEASRDGHDLTLTLRAEDLNRLYQRAAVGAPVGPPSGVNLDDGRGGLTWVDAAAQGFGDGSGLNDGSVYRFLVINYWPGGSSGDYADVHDLHTGLPVATLDWQTAQTTLGATLDEVLPAYGCLYGAYWIDADDGHHWTNLLPVGQVGDNAVAAPYALASDGPWSGDAIPANVTAGKGKTDRPRRVYVSGGSVDAQRFYTDADAPSDGGTAYVSAPGALTEADADAAAAFAFAFLFRALVRGTARVLPHRGSTAYHGWRPGQIVGITDAELTRVTTLAMENIACPIQQVDGTWTGGDLVVELDVATDDTILQRVTSFTYSSIVKAVGTCEITLVLHDPDYTIDPDTLTRIKVYATAATEMQYTLTYGDIPPGSLARMIAVPPNRPGAAARLGPVDEFIFLHGDPGIKDGEQTVMVAAAWKRGIGPRTKAGISHIWTIIQDGDSYSLVPAEGTTMLTDANGQTAVELHRDDSGTPSTQHQFKIFAVPLA